MNKETKQIKAIDLMILDLQTLHSSIRIEAKEHQCETELEKVKAVLLNFLISMRNTSICKL